MPVTIPYGNGIPNDAATKTPSSSGVSSLVNDLIKRYETVETQGAHTANKSTSIENKKQSKTPGSTASSVSGKKGILNKRSASDSDDNVGFFDESDEEIAFVNGKSHLKSDNMKQQGINNIVENYTSRVTIENTVPENVMDMWGERLKVAKPGDPSRLTYRQRMSQADKVKERIERAKAAKRKQNSSISDDKDATRDAQTSEAYDEDAAALFLTATAGKNASANPSTVVNLDDKVTHVSRDAEEQCKQDSEQTPKGKSYQPSSPKNRLAKESVEITTISPSMSESAEKMPKSTCISSGSKLPASSSDNGSIHGKDDQKVSAAGLQMQLTSKPPPDVRQDVMSSPSLSSSSSNSVSTRKRRKSTPPQDKSDTPNVTTDPNSSRNIIISSSTRVSTSSSSRCSSSSRGSSSKCGATGIPETNHDKSIPFEQDQISIMREHGSQTKQSPLQLEKTFDAPMNDAESSKPLDKKKSGSPSKIKDFSISSRSRSSSRLRSSSSGIGNSSCIRSLSGSSSSGDSSISARKPKQQSPPVQSTKPKLTIFANSSSSKSSKRNSKHDTSGRKDEVSDKEGAAFQQHLKSLGISPIVVVVEEEEKKPISSFSLGEDSYLEDMLQQKRDRDVIREEELMDDAVEMFNSAVAEGAPESEALYVKFLEELRRKKSKQFEEMDRIQDELIEKEMQRRMKLAKKNDLGDTESKGNENLSPLQKKHRTELEAKAEGEKEKLERKDTIMESVDFIGDNIGAKLTVEKPTDVLESEEEIEFETDTELNTVTNGEKEGSFHKMESTLPRSPACSSEKKKKPKQQDLPKGSPLPRKKVWKQTPNAGRKSPFSNDIPETVSIPSHDEDAFYLDLDVEDLSCKRRYQKKRKTKKEKKRQKVKKKRKRRPVVFDSEEGWDANVSDERSGEERLALDLAAAERSEREAAITVLEGKRIRTRLVGAFLICFVAFGLLAFFILDPLGRRDDGDPFRDVNSEQRYLRYYEYRTA